MVSDVGDNLPGDIKHLFWSLFDGVHPLNFRGWDEDMYHVNITIDANVNIFRSGSGQAADNCVESLVRDGFHRLLFSLGGGREAGFDCMHPDGCQLAGDLKLLCKGK